MRPRLLLTSEAAGREYVFMIELSTWGHTAMKFRSCQIQTPVKELQVGSNQGRSRIFAVPGVKAGSEDPTSLVDTPGNTSLLPVLQQSQDQLCSCHISVEK